MTKIEDLESVPTSAPAPGCETAVVAPAPQSGEEPKTNCCGVQTGFMERMLARAQEYLIQDYRGNVVGVLLFVVVLGVGIAGVALLEVDSDPDDFIPSGSYAKDYFDDLKDYYTTVGVNTAAYVMNPSYYQKATEMASLRTAMMNDPYIVSSTVDSWYHELVVYNTANSCSASTEAAWYSCLDTFLSSSSGSRYRRQIKFADNTATGSASNPIYISRIGANHIYLEKSNDKVKGMDSFRNTVDSYDSSLAGSLGDPFGFSSVYPTYEGYKVVEEVRPWCDLGCERCVAGVLQERRVGSACDSGDRGAVGAEYW